MSIFSAFGFDSGTQTALSVYRRDTMHIHGAGMNPYAANLHSMAGAEKAAEAQRAAELRKKLLKTSTQVEDQPDSDEGFLVGHWLDSGYGQSRDNGEQQPQSRNWNFSV
jgi:hypothetical protein